MQGEFKSWIFFITLVLGIFGYYFPLLFKKKSAVGNKIATSEVSE